MIAIPELTNTALDLIGMYYRSNEYLLVLVVGYAIILIPLSIILTLLEKEGSLWIIRELVFYSKELILSGYSAASGVTVKIAAVALIVGLILGIILGVLRTFKNRPYCEWF